DEQCRSDQTNGDRRWHYHDSDHHADHDTSSCGPVLRVQLLSNIPRVLLWLAGRLLLHWHGCLLLAAVSWTTPSGHFAPSAPTPVVSNALSHIGPCNWSLSGGSWRSIAAAAASFSAALRRSKIAF